MTTIFQENIKNLLNLQFKIFFYITIKDCFIIKNQKQLLKKILLKILLKNFKKTLN